MALQNPERKGRSATRLFFFERFILSSPGGIANRTVSLRPSVGRGTLLRRAIRGNQLQSIDWVGSPWARRDPFR